MSKILVNVLKISNAAIVALYLTACLVPFIPAGDFWMIAVLGLIFPILFLLVVAFLVFWFVVQWRWSLLSLIALIISWQQLGVIGGFNVRKPFEVAKPAGTLRVFSWNVSSWGETNKSTTTETNIGPKTIDLIARQQADVLCFQEFYDRKEKHAAFSNIENFKRMGYPYHYFVQSELENKQHKTGVIIISKYPIVDTAQFAYGKEDYAAHLIYADILFNATKIRVFTTHLQSVRFDNEQYTALRKIKRTDKTGLKNSRTIIRKLRYAYYYRGKEADLVKQKIMESPYPVIICGDFNDVPNSYSYFTIKGDLQDAFVKKGVGLGRTFRYLSPTLRIDYILAGRQFKVTQFARIIAPYSDHYPVMADFQPAAGVQ